MPARPFLRFGLALARRGWLTRTSMIVAAVITLFSIGRAILIARHAIDPREVALAPAAGAGALAWGAGVLVAFAAATQALRADRRDGITLLISSRGGSTREYLAARIGGLALLLALVVGLGTLAAGGAAALASHAPGEALIAVHATVASLVFSLFFSVTLACVAFAALGARSRPGGYLRLAAVLIVPEIARGLLGRAIPNEWSELASIPSALGALRTSLMPDEIDVLRFVRAGIIVIVFCVIALVVLRTEVARLEREGIS